jgi:hypothetical protein
MLLYAEQIRRQFWDLDLELRFRVSFLLLLPR